MENNKNPGKRKKKHDPSVSSLVLHPSDFTVCSIVGDIMLLVQCTGHEGKMKIYYEW